jgi:hypothetical protein
MGVTGYITFPLVLVCRMTAFEGWESEEDSESEESEEDDSTTGFFTADVSTGFDFRGLAACRKGFSERESERSSERARHLLRLWR